MELKAKIGSVATYWRSLIIVLSPLVLAIIMFLFSTSKETRCGYIIVVMAIYWMTEAVPLAVTALIPIFAFPLFGILSSNDVCLVYMKDTIMMFLGGLMVAIAVENCNLHRRIALFTILKIGQSPRRLMAGFMITAMFLSMWISNTATTAMMVPIVDAILQALYKIYTGIYESKNSVERIERSDSRDSQLVYSISCDHESKVDLVNGDSRGSQFTVHSEEEEPSSKGLTAEPPNEECRALKNMYFLATAYAANIGGTGSLTGTGPNLVVKGVLDSSFREPTDLNFASWLGFNVPGMLLCTFLGWVWLQFIHLGFGKRNRLPNSTPEKEEAIRQMILKEYHKLGRVSFHQKAVLTLFILLVVLWFFREPGFMPGWASVLESVFGDSIKIKDSCPALLIVFALFALPAMPNFWPFKKLYGHDYSGPSPGCLTWEIVHDKVPWGIVLLIGGGFAMAKAATDSGLSFWLGEQMRVLSALPAASSVLILTLVTAMVTEVASNTATASVLMPVLQDLSLGICVNPLYFMLPTAVCCSYAFMLPAATPPNAIVYGAANMKTLDMMKTGFVMNIICVLVINVMINTLGIAMFDVQHIPSWVNSTTGDFIPEC